jgi:excisionase family DNA binding protein
MGENSFASEEWLTLGQAAERLNVHATTLRRWANNGEIPVMLTPGGHRRFAASEVERFARQRHGRHGDNELEQVWADKALTHTRQEITVQQDQQWLATGDAETRSRQRALGRQLMGLTMQFLSAADEGEEILREARALGRQYGEIARDMGLPLTEALQASIFFRDTLVETALEMPENMRIRPKSNTRLLRRINTLLNTVHLAVAEVYDDNSPNSLSRS